MNEDETKEYWKKQVFKKLPLTLFYKTSSTWKAIIWFKDTPEENEIYKQMTFYKDMVKKR